MGDDAAYLLIGVLGESCIHLHHFGVELLCLHTEAAPGNDLVVRVGNTFRILLKRIVVRDLGTLRQNSLSDHSVEDPSSVSIVAIKKLVFIVHDGAFGRLVRRMVGTWAEPHVPGLRRIGGLLILDHLDRLVGEVFRKVIAAFVFVLLGEAREVLFRQLNGMIVDSEVGKPLAGFAADESVEPVETFGQRPLFFGGAGGDVRFRDIVVFANPEGTVATILKDLGDRSALVRGASVLTGEAVGTFGDRRVAVQMVIPAGQKHAAGRRTEGSRVPLRITEPPVGDFLQGGHRDLATKRFPGSEAGVVEEDKENIRGTFLGHRRQVGFPVLG